MQWAARAGLAPLHPMLRRVRVLDAVLDVSGGDSFSDLYGLRRFRSIVLPKQVTLALGIPLVLLPQTYGPYAAPRIRDAATDVLRRATQVWARDERSLSVARDLLGDAFDATRHRSSPDLAFGLPAVPPADPRLREDVEAWSARPGPRLGLNVSGLLWNRPGDDRERFGLRDSYRETIDALLREMLAVEDAELLLVPHVAPTSATVDDDRRACTRILEGLRGRDRRRVLAVPALADPREVKWVIGRTEWFCGTRMHACIAALSQGVATTAIAYSDKTLGVFETAGVGDAVRDPRRSTGAEIVAGAIEDLHRRREIRATLEARRPGLRDRLDGLFTTILDALEPSSGR